MFTKIWQKLTNHFREHPRESLRQTSTKLGIPKSTVYDHQKRLEKRRVTPEAEFWESESGQNFLKRLLVGAIYTFCIKGGIGAGRIEEFMDYLRVHTHAGVSESSIYRMMKEIEVSILRYKELVEQDLQQRASEELKEMEVVLGLDETWLDSMLLVCQELSSGYLFLKSRQKNETQKVGGLPLKNL